MEAHNITLVDQSPHQLEKAKRKPLLQGVTIKEVGCAGIAVAHLWTWLFAAGRREEGRHKPGGPDACCS